MEKQYIVLLDYTTSTIIKIHMSQQQRDEADKYDNFEEYLETLEETYNFRLSDCCWMSGETLHEVTYRG